MILYYNVIDPAEGLTPPSGAEQITETETVQWLVPGFSAKHDEETLVRLHCKVNDHFSN